MERYCIKASEVISLLEDAIAQHGDLTVNLIDPQVMDINLIVSGITILPEQYSDCTPDFQECDHDTMLDRPKCFAFTSTEPHHEGESFDRWCNMASRGFSYKKESNA